MARRPKGKPLTLRPIRLDDDVWAECQRLGKEHGTINEGLRAKLLERLGATALVTEMELPETRPTMTSVLVSLANEPKSLARERVERKPLLKPKDVKK